MDARISTAGGLASEFISANDCCAAVAAALGVPEFEVAASVDESVGD
jgi:hypothetical protein